MLVLDRNQKQTKEIAVRGSTNLETLKAVLSYFAYLNSTGELSDRAFKAIVRDACAIFIENEIEQRIAASLERKLEQFFSSKNPTLKDYIAKLEDF